MFPGGLQKIISTYLIFGVIPLDKFLHVLVGAIITIVMRVFRVRMRYIFLAIGLVCLIKEIIDIQTLQSKIMEGIIDTLVTYIYPVLIGIVIWGKQKMEKKIRESEETIQS